MAPITSSDVSRMAPRGALVAADVFLWFLDGLRSLKALARPAAKAESLLSMPKRSYPL